MQVAVQVIQELEELPEDTKIQETLFLEHPQEGDPRSRPVRMVTSKVRNGRYYDLTNSELVGSFTSYMDAKGNVRSHLTSG